MRIISLIIILFTLLSGCSSTPVFDATGINKALMPNNAVNNESTMIGVRVIWGGVILSSKNLKDATQFEVLGQPLNTRYQPQTDEPPIGRFIIQQMGFLETSLYSAGRKITVLGKLQKHQAGKVGDANYKYPVLESEKLHLWPEETERSQPQTQFHFGLGIQL